MRPDLLQNLYFNCNSKTASSSESFRVIKQIIASVLQSNSVTGQASLFQNRALAYQLLDELVQNFKAEKPTAEAKTHKHLERLNNILRFIGEHYDQRQRQSNNLLHHNTSNIFIHLGRFSDFLNIIFYNENAWGVRIYTSREPNKIF